MFVGREKKKSKGCLFAEKMKEKRGKGKKKKKTQKLSLDQQWVQPVVVVEY